MPKLFIMTPTGEPREVELQPHENTIGRSAGNDVVVNSIYASRRHAVIVVEPAFVTVRDLESQNGTYVNGERVATQALVGGDVIRIGGLDLQFLADDQEFSQVEAQRLRSVPNWVVDEDTGHGDAPTAPGHPHSARGKL
jgi:pSer/pThr/pTyr-binding forkhead associated (FHA) protein